MKSSTNKNVLSIETTGKICGVALMSNHKLCSEINTNNGLTHSVTLFDNIKGILDNNKIQPHDIEKICVSSGPGSFTGIRIGISSALGISKPFNTKIEYIDTLDSLAYNVKSKADIIIPIIDAKANRVFMSLYTGKTLKKLLNDSIYDIDVLISNLNKYFINKKISFIFVGDATITYKDTIKNNLHINYSFADNSNILPKASSLFYVKGDVSKNIKINYMLKSKAERDKENAKN